MEIKKVEGILQNDILGRALFEGTIKLTSAYLGMQETMIRTALMLGNEMRGMDLEEHDMLPMGSRKTVLYVTRAGVREKFGEVVCMREDFRFHLRMNIETEKQDA